ncbi:DUF4391 domain-containing protein [Janthinobacterium sp. 17J80-10]|uniref:DUF4391 domain-containing protein n=1 Tax=Janthinobacterium sp. 17J80-10 TaxID=2497863 RepID=UPI00100549F7|nr:DUF4391 domain-containing protein [Janthinobacterium sp. 17J80-10]QAU35153.1 DUF4391 domain-containing protein [Janthinobacterium sp. 17J80-10]
MIQTALDAISLPESCRVDQRIPKKLLLENGVPTAADKRFVNDSVEELHWIAALKPNTIGVSAYKDEQREYLEIALLTLILRGLDSKAARAQRLLELVHRAIPYPVLLLSQSGQQITLSLAHKRWAQNEVGKVVLDGEIYSATLPDEKVTSDVERAFWNALALNCQPQTTLEPLYQGWIDCIQALKAAMLTGAYKRASSPHQSAARRQALQECEQLEAEATRIRAQAAKEKQIARQVELNLALKRVQDQLANVRKQL